MQNESSVSNSAILPQLSKKMKRSLTTYNATNLGKATVGLRTLILTVPHLWYTLVTRQTLVVVMVLTRHFPPTGVLRTSAFYLLSSVFNYVEQLQQVHKAPTLYIIFTLNDYFQPQRCC